MRADRLLLVLLPLAVACGAARVLDTSRGQRRVERDAAPRRAGAPGHRRRGPPRSRGAPTRPRRRRRAVVARSGARPRDQRQPAHRRGGARRRRRGGARARHARAAASRNDPDRPLQLVHRSAQEHRQPPHDHGRERRDLRRSVQLRDSPAALRPAERTSTLPLDLSRRDTKTLTAAQAGYRGERGAGVGDHLEQKVAVIRAYFDLLEAQRLRTSWSRTSPLDREQLANAQSRFDAGRLTRNELLVVQVALQDGEQQLRRRDFAIDQARWAAQRDRRPAGRRADRASSTSPRRPTLPTGRRGAARRLSRTTPCSPPWSRSSSVSRTRAASLARSRLPALRGRRRHRLDQRDDPRSRRTIGSGFVGFAWDLGTDDRRAAEHRRRPASQARAQSPARSSASCASSKAPSATTQRRRRRAAGRARPPRDAAVGQAEENLRIRAPAVRRRPRHQRGRARRRGAARRSSAPRWRPRSTRRTPAAPSSRS